MGIIFTTQKKKTKCYIIIQNTCTVTWYKKENYVSCIIHLLCLLIPQNPLVNAWDSLEIQQAK